MTAEKINFDKFWNSFLKNSKQNQNSTDSDKSLDEKKKKFELLFNFLDKDGSGNLEAAEINGFNTLRNAYAKREGLDNIFSLNEQELLLNEQKTGSKNKKSLSECGISKSDLSEFSRAIFKIYRGNEYKTISANNLTKSETEALYFIERITKDADRTMTDYDNDVAGILADTVNLWNEAFNKEHSKSTVKKNINKTLEDIKRLSVSEDFESEFLALRGVEYDKKKISNCKTIAEEYASIKTSYDMVDMVKNQLLLTTNGTLNANLHPEEATAAIIKAFNMCGKRNLNDINKILKKIEANHPELTKDGKALSLQKDRNGNWVVNRTPKMGGRVPATQAQLEIIVKELIILLDIALADAIGVKYDSSSSDNDIAKKNQQVVEKRKADYENAFKQAYGGSDAELLTQMYIEKEQKAVSNIRLGMTIIGAAISLTPAGAVGKVASMTAKGAEAAAKAVKAEKAIKNLNYAKAVVAGAMVTHPLDLIEKFTADGKLSKEEIDSWWKSCAESAVFMGLGMGISKVAQTLARTYEAGALVKVLSKGGKSEKEIITLISNNPQNFPENIVKSIKGIERTAKVLQISTESALNLTMTYSIKKAQNDDVNTLDVFMALASAVAGSSVHKQFANMNQAGKERFIQDAFAEFNLSKEETAIIISKINEINASNTSAKSQMTTPAQSASNGNGTLVVNIQTKEQLIAHINKKLIEQGILEPGQTVKLDGSDLTQVILPDGVKVKVNLMIENGFSFFNFGKNSTPQPVSPKYTVVFRDPKNLANNGTIKCLPNEVDKTIADLRKQGYIPTTLHKPDGTHQKIPMQTNNVKPSSGVTTAGEPEYYTLPGNNEVLQQPIAQKSESSSGLSPELKAYFNRAKKDCSRNYENQNVTLSENIGKQYTKVKSLPDNFNLESIDSQIERGGVCTVGNKLYVNDSGKAIELKMTKQTFERLFPENGFNMVEQSQSTTLCTLLSRLNSMTNSKIGRAKLYQMIEQQGDDIVVNLKDNISVTFKGGKPVALDDWYRIGTGASEGLELIEQAILCQYAGVNPSTTEMSELKMALNNATDLMNNGYNSSYYQHDNYLFGNNGVRTRIRCGEPDYRTNITKLLNEFNPDDTFVEAAWGGHARNIVGYDSNTRTVVVHDPYYAGANITYTIDEFISLNPNITSRKLER